MSQEKRIANRPGGSDRLFAQYLARASLAADQIASGTLVCPLKLAAPTAYSYHLLGLPEVVDRPKIAMFRRLLVAEAAATEASVQAIGSPAAAAAAEVAALPVGA